MGKLIIDQSRVSPEGAAALTALCPFGALTYSGGQLEISAACKMCRLCVKKSGGIVTEETEAAAGVDRSQWRGICVYADHSGGVIHRVTYELLGRAKALAAVTGHPVYALVIGSGVSAPAQRLLHYGADKVFVYDDPALEEFRIEPYTAAFCDLIGYIRPSSVLIGATNLGRQLAPRVAARCRAGLTADCTVLEMKENTDLVQIRPAFGGNIMAQIVSPNTRPQFCTVRYKIFDEPRPTEAPSGEIVRMPLPEEAKRSAVTVLSVREKPRDIDISESDVIVAVGRGAASETVRRQAEVLAGLLGGVVACSRPLAEANLYDAKRQIGLSGRTVKPKFILCLGISGAVQFAAGMKSSDCIVAVNSDRNAPIFNVAHYALVGDVNEIVPRLIARLGEVRDNVQ